MVHGMSQRPPRGRAANVGGEGGGGAGKLILLGIGLAVLAGLFHGYLVLERGFWERAVDRAVADAMFSQQYIKVDAKAVRARLREKLALVKNAPKEPTIYVALGEKSALSLPADYAQLSSWQGHATAFKIGAEKVPGCSVQDAAPPDLTLRNIAGGMNGGTGILDRAKGIVDNDPNAVLGRTNSGKTAPVIFVVDVLATFRKGWMKSKRWFHRRCLFYEARRPYQKQPHSATVQAESDAP
ncbi:MAG: hypothetical protein H6727_11285 [Myxococcales bacterium]|nr:hypothetical protein [Myxococcales bacterium]